MDTVEITRDQLESIFDAASRYYEDQMDQLRLDNDNPNQKNGLMGLFHRKSHIDHYLVKLKNGAEIKIIS